MPLRSAARSSFKWGVTACAAALLKARRPSFLQMRKAATTLFLVKVVFAPDERGGVTGNAALGPLVERALGVNACVHTSSAMCSASHSNVGGASSGSSAADSAN
ncbi:hypothetical protein MTO96_015915 [Rhipicephalus appendiculatus]